MSNLGPAPDFSGMDIHLVEPGTEIEGPIDPDTGEPMKLEVTDDNAVFLGRNMYVTQVIYDQLKLKTATKH